MNPNEAVKNVEGSTLFKEFAKENPDYYLAHCFSIRDNKESDCSWDLGYYSKKEDKIVVFETRPEIRARPAEDAFKREGIVKQLDMTAVSIDPEKATDICRELLSRKYSAQTVSKWIFVLQNLERQVYNITLVCTTLSVINIKVDAGSGEVISDMIENVMNFGRVEKGGAKVSPKESAKLEKSKKDKNAAKKKR